ncbi:MAG: hypothetical protein CVT64_09905 [Actinobacteria bacterium HGW-Actinobacteria-4]|nr:MAG: hypothetical protein CVT64_09905 [Actinobacteria bacterium HGW-Actinobacteria-4]
MRITVLGRDFEVAPGTTVGAIAAFAANVTTTCGAGPGSLWCGTTELHPDHPAGTSPVLEGAVLGAKPGPLTHTPAEPHLAVIAGPDAGHLLRVGASLRSGIGLRVGRGADCDLTLEDPALSRAHLRCWEADGLRVEDLGSTNGTVVRDSARARPVVRSRAVRPGTVIAAGQSLLQFRPGETRNGGTGAQWADAPLPELCGAPRTRATFEGGAIAVRGERRWAEGFARAVVLDRGRRPRPGEWSEPWMRWLGAPSGTDAVVLLAAGSSPPDTFTTVAHAGPTGVSIESGQSRRSLPPVCVSAATADAAARRLAAATARGGLPTSVTWGDISGVQRDPGDRTSDSLAHHTELPGGTPSRIRGVAIGADARGPVSINLDAHGPHLLVAGSPGSGMSTLIDTLVHTVAYEHSPRDLALAVFDFGDQAASTLDRLPHLIGPVRGRDGPLALDALEAVDRDIALRRTAPAASHRDSFRESECDGGAPGRLVIVVTEFHCITPHCREFLPRLAQIARDSRGLGVHVVLATTSPAGAVTAQVRAMVGTTIALRVRTEAESRDLVGTLDAARIAKATPGRAVIASGSALTRIQIALPLAAPTPPVRATGTPPPQGGPTLADLTAARWSDAPRPSPWW